MVSSVQRAINAYSNKSGQFITASLYYAVLQILLLLAMAGVFLVMIFFISLLGVSVDFKIAALFSIIVFLIFLYFSSGIFGAYIRSIHLIMNNHKTDLMEFFDYSLTKAPVFFKLMLTKTVLEIFFSALPIAAILLLKNVPYVNIVSMLLIIFISFMLNFIFAFSLFSAAVFDTGFFNSFRNGRRTIVRGHIFAFGLYSIYIFILFTLAIPLVNLITVFVTLPITIATMALFMQDNIRK